MRLYFARQGRAKGGRSTSSHSVNDRTELPARTTGPESAPASPRAGWHRVAGLLEGTSFERVAVLLSCLFTAGAYLDAWSYAEWFNLLGNPAAVVPVGQSLEALPIGVQIVGRPWQEELVLTIAAQVENGCHAWRIPPLAQTIGAPGKLS